MLVGKVNEEWDLGVGFNDTFKADDNIFYCIERKRNDELDGEKFHSKRSKCCYKDI